MSTPPLPELPDVADEGDRPSITDVNGTVARFEMAYSPPPNERFPFRPPAWVHVPSLAYLALGVTIAALVAVAYQSHGAGALYRFIGEGDRTRAVGSPVLAAMVLVSGVATVLRSMMRGVIVHGDGVEMRDVMMLGVPTVKKWAWPQIHRIVVDDTQRTIQIALELWDNTYQRLPPVAKGKELADLLERIGASRNIATTHLARKR